MGKYEVVINAVQTIEETWEVDADSISEAIDKAKRREGDMIDWRDEVAERKAIYAWPPAIVEEVAQ